MDVGRHLVARDQDEQDRQLAEAGRDERQEQQRRLVGPVEVVEDDGDRPVRAELGERPAERLDQRCGAGVEGRDTELRQQRREVRRERAAGLRDGRLLAQALAQHLRDRVVGLGDRRARRAGERHEAGLSERLVREARLADARLAGEQHAAARPGAHGGARAGQRRELPLPADHDPLLEHLERV